jgi:hypothetical protein
MAHDNKHARRSFLQSIAATLIIGPFAANTAAPELSRQGPRVRYGPVSGSVAMPRGSSRPRFAQISGAVAVH